MFMKAFEEKYEKMDREEQKRFAKRIAWGIIMAGLNVILTGVVVFNYSQRYIKDSAETATKGIFFKNTIELKQYKVLGKGNGIFGKHTRISRSDRHDEVISVYEK